jgi:hypothetical protein
LSKENAREKNLPIKVIVKTQLIEEKQQPIIIYKKKRDKQIKITGRGLVRGGSHVTYTWFLVLLLSSNWPRVTLDPSICCLQAVSDSVGDGMKRQGQGVKR